MNKTKNLNKKCVGAGLVSAHTSKARQNKGITLIALIITIIVMLILVSVTISMAINGGLFEKAGEAVGKTENAINKEQELASGKIQIDGEWYDSIDEYLTRDKISIKEVKGKYISVNDVHPTEHELEIFLSSNTITDFSNITVKRVGQNLINIDEMLTAGATVETGGLSKNNDNTYSMSKVDNKRFSKFFKTFIPEGSIIQLSATLVEMSSNEVADNLKIGLRGSNPSEEYVHLNVKGLSNNTIKEYAVPFDVVEVYIWLESVLNNGEYITFKDLQLAINTEEPPSYLPYIEQIVMSNANGTVSKLMSSSPSMFIIADAENVEITCKYQSNEKNIFYNLQGKKIVNFGDSIFAKSQPTLDVSNFLEKYTGATVYNAAFAGCRMSTHDTNYNPFSMFSLANSIVSNNYTLQDNAIVNYSSFPTYFESTVSMLKNIDFNDVDIITIGYGTNDFTGGKGLDNESNNKDTTTFAGALRYSIETIKQKYPNIQIVLCTPMYRFWMDENNNFLYDSGTYESGNGNKLTDFVQTEKDVGREYNLLVIDNYNDLGIDATNCTKYFPATDGTHPNTEGRKLIAEHIAKELYEKFN